MSSVNPNPNKVIGVPSVFTESETIVGGQVPSTDTEREMPVISHNATAQTTLSLEYLESSSQTIERIGAIAFSKDRSTIEKLNEYDVLIPSLRSFLLNQAIKRMQVTRKTDESPEEPVFSQDIKDYAILIQAQSDKNILNPKPNDKAGAKARQEFLNTCKDLLDEAPAQNFSLLCQLLPCETAIKLFAALKAEGLFDPIAPRSQA